MIITPLGHTEFLVDIENTQNENVRILVDIWLSDYAIGDLMERTVKVKLDPVKVSTIDIIYISHSHTDHFDPYSLMQVYTHARPILLLPFTLEYLIPLMREYIPGISIEILYPSKPYIFKGIEITGYMFQQSIITNEDDVMMIAIDNTKELLFAEIDTLPEDDDEEVQNILYKILTKRDYETVCYLASRNELEGQLSILDISAKKRKSWRAEYIAGRKDTIYGAYQKYEYDDFVGFENIYTIPNFVRGFIGQGIRYPDIVSSDYARLQIFPLEEIASMESDIARECGYEFPQRALLPGRQYKAEFGTLESGRKECPIGILEISHEKGDIETTDVRLYASGPLFPRDLEASTIEYEKKRILDILNTRFLPYWSASPVAPLRDALMKNSGTYRIGLKREDNIFFIFEYSLSYSGFIEITHTSDLYIDEEYWFLDIVDFLDGRQELYSNFWHHLSTKTIYRLWTCLGANFCNNELVMNKYRLHFERARQGLDVTNFVTDVLHNIRNF